MVLFHALPDGLLVGITISQWPLTLYNNTKETYSMSQEEDNIPKTERIPFFQRMLDNPFLLLFIGVVMPTVFYILWGIMEIATIPVAE
jgi:hypothetical protein